MTSSAAQGNIGESQFAERMIDFGWSPAQPQIDTGEDFVVTVFSHGKSTGVSFYAQVKSVTNLLKRQHNSQISYSVEVGHLQDWLNFGQPVILIVWDIKLREGRWVLVHDAVAELDTRVPGWQDKSRDLEITVHLPWTNDTTEKGLKHLKHRVRQWMYPLLQSRLGDPNITLRTSFPRTTEGKELHERYVQFIEEGGEITLESKFIESVEVSNKWKQWFDLPKLSEYPSRLWMSNSVQDLPPFRADLKIVNSAQISHASVELKLIQSGTKIIQFSNEHQHAPLKIVFKFSLNQQVSLNLSLHINRDRDCRWSLSEVRAANEFLHVYISGGTLSVEFSDELATLGFEHSLPRRSTISYTEALDLITKLEYVAKSQKVDLALPMDISQTEESNAHYLFNVLNSGKVVLSGDYSIRVSVSDQEMILAKLEQGIKVWIEQVKSDSAINLFDHEFFLGQTIEWLGISSAKLNPSIEISPQEKLHDDETVLLQLIKAERIRVFPDQFKKEAARLANILYANFAVTEVFLFGSLAWGDVIHPETDIDLAVSGLPQGQYIPAMTQLMQSTEYPIDLVDISNIDSKLQVRIRKEGVLLAESSASQIKRNGIEYESRKVASIN